MLFFPVQFWVETGVELQRHRIGSVTTVPFTPDQGVIQCTMQTMHMGPALPQHAGRGCTRSQVWYIHICGVCERVEAEHNLKCTIGGSELSDGHWDDDIPCKRL